MAQTGPVLISLTSCNTYNPTHQHLHQEKEEEEATPGGRGTVGSSSVTREPFGSGLVYCVVTEVTW